MIRARYTPGLAFLAVTGDRAVLLPPTTSGDRLDRVWLALHDGAEALVAAFDGLDDYALLDGDGRSVRVVVRGELTVRATGDGVDDAEIIGTAGGETERIVEGAERVSVALGWAMPKPALPLLGGVVRAASVELVLAAAEKAADEAVADTVAVPADRAEIPHETILPVDVDGDGLYDEHEAIGLAASPEAAADEAAHGAVPVAGVGAAAVVGGAAVVGSAANGGAALGSDSSDDEAQESAVPARTDDEAGLPADTEPPAEPLTKTPADARPVAHPATIPLPTSPGLGDHDGNTVLPGELAAARAAAPVDGDHDGNTVSVDQAQAMRPAAPVTPAAEAAERTVARVSVSNGSDVRLDRPVLIGRRPRSVRQVGDDVPHLITVESPMHDISRNHVEIKIEDDVAMVTDLNSTNGTLLYRDGDPQRLHPGERTILIEGDTLDLGEDIIVSFTGLP